MAVFEMLEQGSTNQAWRFSVSQLFFQQEKNKARTGVLPSGDGTNLAVSQTTTASTSVQVQAGACVIADASISQGAHVMCADAVTEIDVLGDNPSTSLPRIDLIVMDGANGELKAVTGTPAAVPTAPDLPATSLLLATLSIAANADKITGSNITDGRVYSALRGATLWLNDRDERDNVEDSCQAGQQVWVVSEQRMYTKQPGSGWDDILTSDLLSPESGWNINEVAYSRRGGFVFINITTTRTGSTLTANSSGNLIDADATVGALNDSKLVPGTNSPGIWSTTSGSGVGAHGSAISTTAGNIILADCNNNGTIATNQKVTISLSYPAAS